MKWIIGIGIACFIFFSSSFSYKGSSNFSDPSAMVQDTTFDVAAAIASIKESIKGRENEPASEVFENIQMMGQFPAGRLLAIMERAFNGSLGVACNHCHNPNDWASDEKEEKQIARDMWKMVGQLNQDLLGAIPNLKGPQPVVNCTTCHRGEVKPALNLK